MKNENYITLIVNDCNANFNFNAFNISMLSNGYFFKCLKIVKCNLNQIMHW